MKEKFKNKIEKIDLNKLPPYYRLIEEMPLHRKNICVTSNRHNGIFYLPDKFYKPISKIINPSNFNDKF